MSVCMCVCVCLYVCRRPKHLRMTHSTSVKCTNSGHIQSLHRSLLLPALLYYIHTNLEHVYVYVYAFICVCVWQVLFVCVTSLYCSFCSDACAHSHAHRDDVCMFVCMYYAHWQLFIIINMSLVLSHIDCPPVLLLLLLLPACRLPMCLPYGASTVTATTSAAAAATTTIITY